MLYMVVETFTAGARPVYARFRDHGRMLPDGLAYVDSWRARDDSRCYQLMRTDDPALLETWMAAWRDLVDFEVVAVEESGPAGT